MPLDRLDTLAAQARSQTPLVGPLVRRRAVRRLWSRGTPEAIRRLAVLAAGTDDAGLKAQVLRLLDKVADTVRGDVVAAVWAETRDAGLGDWLGRKQWLAAEPLSLRVLTALYTGLHEGMQEAPAAAVPTLVRLTADADRRVADRAGYVLRALARPDAREAVCDAFLNDAHPAAREAAFAGGYQPANAARRALFYFLTGQWQKYESLDFDGSFLRSAYEVASPALRQRLATVAREAGRIEYVAAAAREGRRVGEMTDVEWESAVAVLAGGGRWDDLWRLAGSAPPRWAAKMVLRLAAEEWLPPGMPGGLSGLAESARDWQDAGASAVAGPVTLDGHAKGIVAVAAVPATSSRGVGSEAAASRPAGGAGSAPWAGGPDGIVVTSGDDRAVRIWTMNDQRSMVRQLGQTGTHLAVGPDGRSLAVGQADGTVTFWGLPEGRQIARAHAHVGAVTGLATLSVEGRLPGVVASATLSAAASSGSAPSSSSLSSDGSILVSTGEDGKVRLWSLPDGRELRTLGRRSTPLTRLAVTPGRPWAAAADADGGLYLWDLARQSVDPLWAVPARGTGDVTDLRFADGGQTLAACAGGEVTLVRCPTGKPVHGGDARVGRVTAAVAPTGARFVCAGGTDGRVSLVRAADGVVLRSLDAHPAAVTAVAASPDGHLLATAGADGTIRLWGLPDGHPLATLPGGGGAGGGAVRHLLFGPAGQTLLAAADGDPAVRVWTVEPLRLGRVPLAEMTIRDLQGLQAAAAADPRGPAAPAAFAAALLARRFEHDVMLGDVAPAAGRVVAGPFDIELG
jgi:WD40 repeat protein